MYCRANTWKGISLIVSLASLVGSTTDFDKLSTVALSSLVELASATIAHLIGSKDLFLSLQ